MRKNYPDSITLVLTAHERNAYLAGMIDAGVAGFITKTLKAGAVGCRDPSRGR
jgi:DNA-binding NarL/FixJ family response regulator